MSRYQYITCGGTKFSAATVYGAVTQHLLYGQWCCELNVLPCATLDNSSSYYFAAQQVASIALAAACFQYANAMLNGSTDTVMQAKLKARQQLGVQEGASTGADVWMRQAPPY